MIGKGNVTSLCCTHGTIGKIVDPGITDADQMGAAMAPAALDTISTYLKDTGRSPDYYDLILTGDLGKIGSQILVDLASKQGLSLAGVHNDCGVIIYDDERMLIAVVAVAEVPPLSSQDISTKKWSKVD